MLILEFQGEFEHSTADTFDDLELGNLTEKAAGNYELLVGNHLLRGRTQFYYLTHLGKLTPLTKPQVLSERVLNKDG